jgi:hypothetical protein
LRKSGIGRSATSPNSGVQDFESEQPDARPSNAALLLSITKVRDTRILRRHSRASGNPLVLEPNLDPRLRGDDANFAQAVIYFGNSR